MFKKSTILVLATLTLFSCNNNPTTTNKKENKEIPIVKNDALLAFGSCSNQAFKETMWSEVNLNKPDVWIWGGDAVYSDTEDPEFMKEQYRIQKSNPDYQILLKQTEVIGTWDDHDYGANDAGEEYPMKYKSKEMFLDFLDTPKDDIVRQRDGVYNSHIYKYDKGSIKVILLDARFFRSKLTPDTFGNKRYLNNSDSTSTMLGEAQWNWLKNELTNSNADFNIIVSGVQVLSNLHGFECWGNMPLERTKLINTIAESKANGVFILSGDRHVCEISKIKLDNMPYPIYDITSSGLTHSYTNVGEEENPYRVSELIGKKNFTLLNFNFSNKTVDVEIRGKKNIHLIDKHIQY